MPFRGWPAEAIAFYEGLEADNSKAYWTANKATYEECVRAPFLALADEVRDEVGELRLFRPYRDVRFSKDKTPYKTAAGAAGELEGGSVVYVQLSAAGLFVASGYYQPAADQLERFRVAVADDRSGPQLEEVVASLRQQGFDIGGEALKVAPRGFARDHPRVALLRHKGVTAGRTFAPARWLSTAKARDRVLDTWRAAAPLHTWLDRHVGPSTLPPDDAGR
ncbi:MAG TPA: DUF2461 domain-containing protein [Acidimicrobiales bacterium]|nr:DUF2461 domain-containing protein [Acidimicrobiales bacterium]